MTHRRRIHALAAAGLIAAVMVATAGPAAAGTTYEVKPGDTLSTIARDHGVTTAELAGANGITDLHLIRVGQVLTIPVAEPTTHTVSAGETLSGIARAYGVPWADLAAENDLDDPHFLSVGQVLRLPAGASLGTGSPLAAIAAAYPSLPEHIVADNDRLGLVPSFERWAAHYGVPADLLMAVAYQESGWQAAVVSHKDAVGVGQLMPATSTWVANELIGIPELDPTVPDDNIRMSARFLAWLIGYTGGESEALAAYYQGPTSVAVNGWFEDTEAYVANVEAMRWRFQRS
jgi:LysM repeat protein